MRELHTRSLDGTKDEMAMVANSKGSPNGRIHPVAIVFTVTAMMVLSFLSFPFENQNVRADHLWATIRVDDSEPNGWDSSIAMDSNNLPHISYYGGKDGMGALKYAHYDGTLWNITYVDTGSPMMGVDTSLALDSTDRPHIAYFDKSNGDLKYARLDGVVWVNETVESEGDVGYNPSLDMDSLDRPHIAYNNATSMTLRYAHWNGTSWVRETIDFTGDVGYPQQFLELDSSDRPHVVYHASAVSPNSSLRYAHWNGSSWAIESVPIEEGYGHGAEQSMSMALDSSDRPHISYVRHIGMVTTEVRHIFWNGTEWIDELVTFFTYTDSVNSLELDSRDRPHIAFVYDEYLFYTYKDNSSWHSEIAHVGTEHFDDPFIALDSYDMPHISHGHSSGAPWYLWYVHIASPPIPDLTLTDADISFDPPSPVLNGTSVNISAFVHNVGFGDAYDVTVTFHDGFPEPSNVIDERNMSGLDHLEAKQVQTSWIASPTGIHDICVVVDPYYNITESDETNNQACKQIEVHSSETPRPPTDLRAHLSGQDLENVTLMWNLSPDDGAGRDNVEGYGILRGSLYDSSGSGYSNLSSSPAGTSIFVDVSAGEGDPSNYFYLVCAVSDSNLSDCSSGQAGKFTRPLFPGPNLVSIPLVQSNESIETVLQTVQYDKAWFYDSSSQKWKWHMTYKGYRRGLFNINHTMGIWVNVTQNSNLTVAGVVPAITRIQLYAGWNLVGFPSFNSSLTVSDMNATVGAIRVEGFDSSAAPFYTRVLEASEVLQAGFGYWVRVEADTDWIVEVS
ncbi:MAG: CARDB domain-containing protein [Thermoplasmata archaeon]